MFYLKDILYGIRVRKKTSILILMQLTFTLFISYGILNIYLSGTVISSNNKWALQNIDNIYLINFEDPSLVRNSDLYTDSINKVKEKNLGTIASYNPLSLSINNIFNEDSYVIGLSIDKNYYDMLNDTLIVGEGFTKDDFNSTSLDYIPIILGSDYKNKCKINDIVKDSSNQKYIVRGFLKPNKYLTNSNYDLTTYIKSENSFLIPILDSSNIYGSLIKFYNNMNPPLTIDNLTFNNMKESIKSQVNDFLNFQNQWIPFLILSLIVAILGIIISTILSIFLRRKELGIKIVLGESINSILLKTYIENLILSILAIIFNIAFTYIFNMDFINATNFATTESIIYVNFDLEFLIISFASIILLTLLTSMMVFKIIKKIQPKELIGGVY